MRAARPAAVWLWLAVIAGMLAMTTPPAMAQLPAVGLRGDEAQFAADRQRLFALLAASRTEFEARIIEADIWRLWMLAPDAEAAALMTQSLARRRAFDLAGSVAILDDLIAVAPEWAEAWNQRATVRYMQGNLQGSLADIDETLQREPNHFGAISGQVLIYTRQGRSDLVQSALRRAVKIHPFLRERTLIVEPPGRDI